MAPIWTADRPTKVPVDEAQHLAQAYPALLVQADRIANTVMLGFHGRRRPGSGESFWQFQRYRAGEEASRIDWRKSARSDQLYIRQNEWEAANTVWMWASAAPGMAFRSRLASTTKRERALLVLLTLSALMLSAGERVGILGSGRHPVASRNGLERLAAIATGADQEASGLPHGAFAESGLPQVSLPRYSNVILISDFLVPLDALRESISSIAARDVRGHLVQIFDPAEENLPYTGRKEFEETGGGPLRFIIGRTESVRDAYRARIETHRAGLRELAQRLGWSFTLHHTDQPPQRAILPLYGRLSGNMLTGG
ncbi:DUF58 domain-containing protein [Rhodoligotrophos defluvii]|uniref:DUF58 domain-containing protein n=1 Tax=Rhodoligotrophos defluvii TaxID=2561934 RepID=UPI0010C95F4B|nr:DUF58 domain-containing protein [Rhodoligotrophos defluvii]